MTEGSTKAINFEINKVKKIGFFENSPNYIQRTSCKGIAMFFEGCIAMVDFLAA